MLSASVKATSPCRGSTPDEPGDLIFTGTPGGVGVGFKPARWLKAGGVDRVEIDRIGAIESRVVAEGA